MSNIKNAVLLAAGSGSRLAPITNDCHKSLLTISGAPALQRIIDVLIAEDVNDIVVVTGYKRYEVEYFIKDKYGDRVRCVYNDRFGQDTNILSVNVGVNNLYDASLGYLIVETDLVIEKKGWLKVLEKNKQDTSFWVTKGKYSIYLRGGILKADESGRVTELAYRPEYNSAYSGWNKLVGILYVCSADVKMDNSLREQAIKETIQQYYMMPWVNNINEFFCFYKDLGDMYAGSYNDIETYTKIDKEFKSI